MSLARGILHHDSTLGPSHTWSPHFANPERSPRLARHAWKRGVRAFPIGADVEVVVLEVEPSGRRTRLSAKAIQDAREADEVREYSERVDATQSESFGSLADKLRGALKAKE